MANMGLFYGERFRSLHITDLHFCILAYTLGMLSKRSGGFHLMRISMYELTYPHGSVRSGRQNEVSFHSGVHNIR